MEMLTTNRMSISFRIIIMDIKDKILERDRYDIVARNSISIPDYRAYPPYHIPPYQHYLGCLKSIISPSSRVLEIGSGLGLFTRELIKTDAAIVASDISGDCLEFLSSSFSHADNLETLLLDMELLNLEGTFDVICASGALSYGDNNVVLSNIYKALKPGGHFICVDSLDNNYIYRINRFIHFLLGERSFSTLKNMPDLDLINRYRQKFSEVEVRFFGSFCWIVPFLRPFLSPNRISIIINSIDEFLSPRSSAFKFVMVCRKKHE